MKNLSIVLALITTGFISYTMGTRHPSKQAFTEKYTAWRLSKDIYGDEKFTYTTPKETREKFNSIYPQLVEYCLTQDDGGEFRMGDDVRISCDRVQDLRYEVIEKQRLIKLNQAQ